MEKLKPCPFCGGEPEVTYQEWNENSFGYMFASWCNWGNSKSTTRVRCKRCKVEMIRSCKKLAFTAWNRRADDGQIH